MLQVQHIQKAFDGRPVLRDVSFCVPAGSIYGLIGKNGAGKTTLMNLIAGLLAPDAGDIARGGTPGGAEPVGYLPDLPAFFDYLTARETLDFLLAAVPGPKPRKRREALLRQVGLQGPEKARDMSRGMRQRLGIAAALVSDPPILLLDEPTSALDPQGRHELMAVLGQLREAGKAILLSTHILADMETVCDAVGFLHQGVIAREVDVPRFRQGSQGVWEVTFDGPPDLPGPDPRLAVTPAGPCTFRFAAADQKYLLAALGRIPQEILAIHNQAQTLDQLFQEVYQ